MRTRCLVLVCVALAVSARSRAQVNDSDALFREGKALMDDGRTAEACAKFSESLALTRRGGTLLNLAVCREKEGRYATALALLAEARELAQADERDDRLALIDERVAALRSHVSTLTVRVSAADTQLRVELDGELVPQDHWNRAEPRDPGNHTIVATAPGYQPFQTLVRIPLDASDSSVEIPALVAIPERPRAPVATAQRARVVPSSAPRTQPQGDWRAPVSWLALGVGSAALVVGGVFGVKAIRDARASKRACSADACPNGAYDENHDAAREAHIADVVLPAGLALVGGGVYLALTATHRERAGATAPTALELGGSWVRLRGSF